MRGWRVVDNTEIVLGPLWQERENERKHLKILVENVQDRLNEIQKNASGKEAKLESQKENLEHHIILVDKLTTENIELKDEVRFLKERNERLQTELSTINFTSKSCRNNLEDLAKQLAEARDEAKDANIISKEASENEKIVREELNDVYEKLRLKNTQFSNLEQNNIENKQTIQKLEKQKQADQKRITYLLRKIDTLFSKLSDCRAKLETTQIDKKTNVRTNIKSDATTRNLSRENTKLTRTLRKKNKELDTQQETIKQQSQKITELKINLRNTKLAKDLLAKRLHQWTEI